MMMNDNDMKEKVLQEIMDLMDQHQGEGMKKPKVLEASIEVKKDPMAIMDASKDPDQDGDDDSKSVSDMLDAAKQADATQSPGSAMDLDSLDPDKVGDSDKLTPEMIARLASMMKK